MSFDRRAFGFIMESYTNNSKQQLSENADILQEFVPMNPKQTSQPKVTEAKFEIYVMCQRCEYGDPYYIDRVDTSLTKPDKEGKTLLHAYQLELCEAVLANIDETITFEIVKLACTKAQLDKLTALATGAEDNNEFVEADDQVL